ncbi:double-cubane-cluster-containing anaerobic reductase [Methanoregula sp. UBA64]|jgi:benzoyl-CoA reductase/2-hydroxyglutaryl-CoA dehydratase subunit BcrC/BadD/HgdB|uniref:double-cubane-cluster-containing anaerobic reductase n=1 Tax=Methanoregula sp. UBA64 TaxID=1915554 RepID=UPI0025F4A84D|nr:double-cubane-cluster-containing anaerobic reductase [Methanoregula sp. UBA64]
MADYTEMWKSLGIDVENHNALLAGLGQAYTDIFLSQKNRPEGMKYFDFVVSEVHGLRIKEIMDAKAQGKKVIGSYCVFVPEELVLAVDGVAVGLCAGAELGFEAAEELLPRNTCSLIKSMFGFKLGKLCPYVESCDVIVGENTCDGKKKAYEIFRPLVKDLYVMDLPQTKSDAGRLMLKEEYRKFIAKLEQETGKKITVQSLKKAIETVNAKRKAMIRLAALRAADPAPISGLDALLINQVFFHDDPARFTDSVNKLCDELETRVKEHKGVMPKGTTRIIVSGCPMAVPNWKLPMLIETSNAVIVGEESCVGERGTRWLTEIKGNTVEELLDAITDRYFNVDCAVFTPNPSRVNHVKEMAKNLHADGVLHYSLQFCQPYIIESGPVEKELENSHIPTLRLETDYSQEDAGQLKTRIEAFNERLKKK